MSIIGERKVAMIDEAADLLRFIHFNFGEIASGTFTFPSISVITETDKGAAT